MRKKIKGRRSPGFEPVSRPVAYPHEVEAWIHASVAAVRGLILILKLLERPQPQMSRMQRQRIKRAVLQFRKSTRWLRVSVEPVISQPELKSFEMNS